MNDDQGPGPTDPVVPDNAFEQFRRSLLAEHAAHFDDWLARATAAYERPTTKIGSIGDLLDFVNSSVDSDAIRDQVSSVYELAGLCFNFVCGELWAWAFLNQRRGRTVETAVEYVTQRVPMVQSETYARKWVVGLRALDGSRQGWNLIDGRLEDTPLARGAWDVVVDEVVPSYIEDCLLPALRRRETDATIAHVAEVVTAYCKHLQMAPAALLDELKLRTIPYEQPADQATAEFKTVTPAIVARRRKIVKMYRLERGFSTADLARHVRLDESVIRAIVREDRHDSKCTDFSRDVFLKRIGRSIDDWYATRD